MSFYTALRRSLLAIFLVLLLFSLTACKTPAPDIASESYDGPDPEDTAADGMNCTLIIRCDTILDHLDSLTEGKEELVPEDGLLLEATGIPFTEGESVFDVLKRELQSRRMHLEFSETPVYDAVYIEGICNLYEYDCGELSGWTFRVNGETPGYSCSKYFLSDGDVIEWLYTCDLGDDL